MLSFCLFLLLQACLIAANTEKAIFLGPPRLQIPTATPTLTDLNLVALSPSSSSIRSHLNAQFPTSSSQHGQSTWLLLHSLKEGQRYEVRVCWAATQPTSFRLDTYELESVFGSSDLVSSLAQFADSRQVGEQIAERKPAVIYDNLSSVLLLRIQAAADYYTTNQTLMQEVPPVDVDIILDPFILNVVPKSLIPTAAYIIFLAIGSWFLSSSVDRWIRRLAIEETDLQKKLS